MSKSKGNVIYADDLVRLFGVDAVRFFVLLEMPFDNDGQISWELVAERYNSELANVLGNLVSRTVAMIFKYFGGTVERGLSAEEDPDAEFKATVRGTAEKVRAKADSFHIADAITEIFSLFRAPTSISTKPCLGRSRRMRAKERGSTMSFITCPKRF